MGETGAQSVHSQTGLYAVRFMLIACIALISQEKVGYHLPGWGRAGGDTGDVII